MPRQLYEVRLGLGFKGSVEVRRFFWLTYKITRHNGSLTIGFWIH